MNMIKERVGLKKSTACCCSCTSGDEVEAPQRRARSRRHVDADNDTDSGGEVRSRACSPCGCEPLLLLPHFDQSPSNFVCACAFFLEISRKMFSTSKKVESDRFQGGPTSFQTFFHQVPTNIVRDFEESPWRLQKNGVGVAFGFSEVHKKKKGTSTGETWYRRHVTMDLIVRHVAAVDLEINGFRRRCNKR